MFQKFHENTQVSRVVKNILATEPIPVLQTVSSSIPLIDNCMYVHKGKIVEGNSSIEGGFKPIPDGVVSTCVHNSSVSWYDSETHKYLGNYLRYLRDSVSVNLMPYYNCYNGTELDDIYLDVVNMGYLRCSDNVQIDADGNSVPKVTPSNSICCGSKTYHEDTVNYSFGTDKRYRVVAIPIRFDTVYTVAVDSSSPVMLRSIIYDTDLGMVREYASNEDIVSTGYYSDYLDYSSMLLPFSRFSDPFLYSVPLASRTVDSKNFPVNDLYARQKDLYMILQIPSRCNSSIVVLEGNYTHKHKEVTQCSASSPEYANENINTLFIPEDYNNEFQTVVYPDNLSLLYYNTGVSYAFSDRLVEYLLLNVMNEWETLSTNIARVQDSLATLYESYRIRMSKHYATRGLWDDSIKYYIKSLVSKNINNVTIPFDHDGYINKDVEGLLSSKGAYTT